MSRWISQLNEIKSLPEWMQFTKLSDTLQIDDLSDEKKVSETNRLKKIVAQLSSTFDLIDPELVGLSVWDQVRQSIRAAFNSLNSYQSGKDIQHLMASNNAIDTAVAITRPYLTEAENKRDVVISAYEDRIQSIERFFETKSSQLNESYVEISALLEGVKAENKKIQTTKQKIDDFDRKLFEGSDDAPALSSEIEKLMSEMRTAQSEIKSYRSLLLEGTPEQESIRASITQAANEISANTKSARSNDDMVAKLREKIEAFAATVFIAPGASESENLQTTEGHLRDLINKLTDFEKEQNAKYIALNTQIEELLPGATSAGLGAAYEELENSFTPQIETYTKIFFGTVVGIFIISFVLTVDTVIVWPFELTFSKFGSLPEVLKYFAFRLPILFPLVWLAIFASRRRGQYERLQQEYAHKKALARSYYSYKNQIDDLGEGHSELSGDLIKVMVDAISFNASQTLSGQAEAKVSRSTLDLVRDLVDPKNRPQ